MTIKVNVAQGVLTAPVADPTTIVYTTTNTLADITLPENWGWKDATTKLTVAQSTYVAVYTGTDADNYLNGDKEFDVTVKVTPATLTEPSVEDMTYVVGKTLSQVSLGDNWTWATSADAENTLLTAGPKTFVAVYVGADAGNYSNETTILRFTVAQAELPVIPQVLGLKATYGQTLADVTLPVSDEGIFRWAMATGTSVGNAGTNPFNLIYTPNDTNYKSATIPVTIEVAKADYNMSGVSFKDVSVVYRAGISQADEIEIAGVLPGGISVEYTFTDEAGRTVEKENVIAIGKYTVTATFTGEDGNHNPIPAMTATLTITDKLIPSYTLPTGLKATYGQTLANVTLPTGFTFEDPLTTPVGNAGINTFKVTFTPANTEMYETLKGLEVQINVEKGTFTLPNTVKFESKAVDYDEMPHDLTVDPSTIPNGINVTYRNNGKTEVGIYTVTAVFTIEEGSELSKNYNSVNPITKEATLTIEKVVGIKVVNPPEKVEYNTDIGNFIVSVRKTNGTTTYDGTPVRLSDCSVSGYNGTQTGLQTVQVAYKGQTDSFDIIVDNNINSITANYATTEVLYGSILYETKILATKNYDNGESKNIDNSQLTVNMPERAIPATGKNTVDIKVSYTDSVTGKVFTDTITLNVTKPSIDYIAKGNAMKLDDNGITTYAVNESVQICPIANYTVVVTTPSGVSKNVESNMNYSLTSVGTYTVKVYFGETPLTTGTFVVEAAKYPEIKLKYNDDGTVYGIEVSREDLQNIESIKIKRTGKTITLTAESFGEGTVYVFTENDKITTANYTISGTTIDGDTIYGPNGNGAYYKLAYKQ